MKKQYIYLAIAGGFVVVVFVILVAIQSASEKASEQKQITPTSPESNTEQNLNTNKTQADINQSSPGNNSLTPDQVVKNFYLSYKSSPDLLSSGGYKKDKRVSQELINFVQAQYDGKNDPIFCPANRVKDFIVDTPEYSVDGNVAYVTIRESAQGGKQLYAVELDKINGAWLIATTQCL